MQCPGQDSRYWKPGAIFEAECPECGQSVEFFKDDTARKCPACGHRFVNPKMDFGCAAYCQHAEQCLGSLPPEVVAQQEELLKDKVALAMRRHFGTDHKRASHAGRVAGYAERLGKEEKGDLAVILIAAYFHDIGQARAEQSDGDNAAERRLEESAHLARTILEGLGAKQDLIDEVAEIIRNHHRTGQGDSLNAKILFDADLLVTLEDGLKESSLAPADIEERLEKSFLTSSGRSLARETLSPSRAPSE